MLVVDATVVVQACLLEDGFAQLPDQDLIAPPLMWSEVRSTLHRMSWSDHLDDETARTAAELLESCPVRVEIPDGVGAEAWRLADLLGWARTYDAEYVATASLMGCRLVTADMRLVRGTERLGIVVPLTEL